MLPKPAVHRAPGRRSWEDQRFSGSFSVCQILDCYRESEARKLAIWIFDSKKLRNLMDDIRKRTKKKKIVHEFLHCMITSGSLRSRSGGGLGSGQVGHELKFILKPCLTPSSNIHFPQYGNDHLSSYHTYRTIHIALPPNINKKN